MGKFTAAFPRIQLLKLTAGALYVLAVIYAVVIAGYSLQPATAGLVAAALVYLLFSRKVYLPRAVFLAGAAFFAVLALSSLFSISPRRSFEQTWILLAAAFFVVVLANLRAVENLRELTLQSLLVVGLAWMVFSWRDTVQWYLTWRETNGGQGLIPDLSYRLNGGNTIAAFYSILFFIALILIIRTKTGWIRAVMAAYLASLAALLFLSSSRGAWVGLVVGLLVLMIFERRLIGRAWRFVRKSRVLSAAAVLAALGLLAAFAVVYQKYVAGHPTHGAGMNRAPFWTPAWEAFLASPLIGNGPYTGGTFYVQSASVPWSHLYLHAHNTYLDILRDAGIVGLISFAALVFFLFRSLLRAYRANREDYFTEIVICAAAAFLGHSFFDGNYLMPFAAVSLLALIGVGLKLNPPVQPGVIQIKAYALAAGAVVLMGAAYLLWNRSLLSAGIESYRENDLAGSAAYFERSKRLDPGNPVGYIYHGLAAARLGAEGRPERVAEAVEDFRAALRLDPNWAVTHANLAALYRSRGEISLAKGCFEKSRQLAPGWYVPRLNLGLIYEGEQEDQRAKEAYLAALNAYPEIAGSSFWTLSSLRRDALAEWRGAHPPADVRLKDYPAVMGQESPAPMLRLANQLIETDLALAQNLWLRSKLVYPSYPSVYVERTWLEAEIRFRQGDLSGAISAGEAALEQVLSDGLFGPGSAGASLYADGLYRAPVLPVEFVPQLITIPLPGEWESRLFKLAQWQTAAGDQAACRITYSLLLKSAPGYPPENQKPSPCEED